MADVQPPRPQRPSPLIGLGMFAGSVAAGAVALWLGSALLVLGAVVGMVVALVECGAAFDGWLLASRTRSHGGVEVVRRLFGVGTLRLTALGPGAEARRGSRAFAAVHALTWRVDAPAKLDIDVVIERRTLLARAPGIGDEAFDKLFSVTARGIDPLHIAARISAPARAALARLFLAAEVARVELTSDGRVLLVLTRRRNDPAPVLASLEDLASLVDELGRPTRELPSISALRVHSPEGNPVGVG